MKQTKDEGLNFVKLGLTTLRIILVTGASFANAKDEKSKLSLIILMADTKGRSNIVHYGSNRCRRVKRSVMAAERHEFLLGLDHALVVREIIAEIL